MTGKGDLFRTASFGRKTAKAIDRYLRSRRAHADAESEEMWLGLKGPLTGSGVRQMLWRRSEEAGTPRMHPHELGTTSRTHGSPAVGGSPI